jgi:hypothetical protein
MRMPVLDCDHFRSPRSLASIATRPETRRIPRFESISRTAGPPTTKHPPSRYWKLAFVAALMRYDTIARVVIIARMQRF